MTSFLLALAPLALDGCHPLGDFSETVCVDKPATASQADLTPVDADFIALRADLFLDDEERPTQLLTWGAPCSRASDVERCKSQVAALALSSPLTRDSDQEGTTYDVQFTRGDEIGTVTTTADLITLLGTIDTPTEAQLVAFAKGYRFSCEEQNARTEHGRFVFLARSGGGCSDAEEFEVGVASDGTVTEGAHSVVDPAPGGECTEGRRPPRWRHGRVVSTGAGGTFSRSAHLEAASVYAFVHLARELHAHGAPRALVRASLRSAREEVRHARVVAGLARRYGSRCEWPRVSPSPIRSLIEVVTDNAREGCVRETFGAVVAGAQALSSSDGVVRRAYRGIARDEARHASLSWAIDAWAATKLGAVAARRVHEVRCDAAIALADELARSRALPCGVLGLPDAEGNARIHRALSQQLFSARSA